MRLLIFILVLYMLSGSANALGGCDHEKSTLEALSRCNEPICNDIRDELDACMAGIGAPDVAVLWYYAKWSNYQTTHMFSPWQKCSRIAKNKRARVFCACGMAHLAQDSPIHNEVIPWVIRNNKQYLLLDNDWALHPLTEAKSELECLENRQTDVSMMIAIDEFLPLMEEIFDKDFESEAHILQDVYGTDKFYTGAYGGYATGFMAKTYRYLVAGAEKLPLNYPDLEPYKEQGIENTLKVWRGQMLPEQDATGYIEIGKADTDVIPASFKFGLTGLFIMFMLVYNRQIVAMYVKFKYRR